jgi:hypothetical protein
MCPTAADASRITATGCSPTNPINVPYYQRFGFQAIGELALLGRGPVITNMWREARL